MEQLVSGTAGLFGLMVFMFLCVLAVLAIMTPFFIFRIRNELIQINNRLGVLVERAIEAGFKTPQA